MQLSEYQRNQLDKVIELYLDGEAQEVVKPLESYLNSIDKKEQDMMKSFINMEKIFTSQKDKDIINNHLSNLYTIFLEKGIIKDGEKEKDKSVADKRAESRRKVKKLERYKRLYFTVQRLIAEYRATEEEKIHADSIQAVDYSKDKVKTSVGNYQFKTITYDIKLEGLEQQINKYIELLKQEEEFLKKLIESIEDFQIKHIFYARYIMFEDYEEISKQLHITLNTCRKYHSAGLKKLDI